MDYRASRITTVDLTADRTIASGETITVFGISVANSGINPVEVEITNGSGTIVIRLTVLSYTTHELQTEFISDSGLAINALDSDGATTYVSVFHSSGGA